MVAHEISDIGSEDDVLKQNDFNSDWLVYTFLKSKQELAIQLLLYFVSKLSVKHYQEFKIHLALQ